MEHRLRSWGWRARTAQRVEAMVPLRAARPRRAAGDAGADAPVAARIPAPDPASPADRHREGLRGPPRCVRDRFGPLAALRASNGACSTAIPSMGPAPSDDTSARYSGGAGGSPRRGAAARPRRAIIGRSRKNGRGARHFEHAAGAGESHDRRSPHWITIDRPSAGRPHRPRPRHRGWTCLRGPSRRSRRARQPPRPADGRCRRALRVGGARGQRRAGDAPRRVRRPALGLVHRHDGRPHGARLRGRDGADRARSAAPISWSSSPWTMVPMATGPRRRSRSRTPRSNRSCPRTWSPTSAMATTRARSCRSPSALGSALAEPAPTTAPGPTDAPAATPTPSLPPGQDVEGGSGLGTAIMIIVVVAIVGLAGWFFFVRRRYGDGAPRGSEAAAPRRTRWRA